MDYSETCQRYFTAFADKDLKTLSSLFSENISLTDWVIGKIQGRSTVIDATKKIFDSFEKIRIQIRSMTSANQTVSAELEISLDQNKLLVVDVIDFDLQGRIAAIRAYKGN